MTPFAETILRAYPVSIETKWKTEFAPNFSLGDLKKALQMTQCPATEEICTLIVRKFLFWMIQCKIWTTSGIFSYEYIGGVPYRHFQSWEHIKACYDDPNCWIDATTFQVPYVGIGVTEYAAQFSLGKGVDWESILTAYAALHADDEEENVDPDARCCEYCGKVIDGASDLCPHCGAPV